MKMMLQAMVFSVLCAFGAQAQDADIQGVISQQIEAFKADDFATAFTYASPNLQTYFRTPENFGKMVTQGYPMVWRPARVDFLELTETGGAYFQKVQITDQKGRFHVLEYRLQQDLAGWRIHGVRILEAPGLAA